MIPKKLVEGVVALVFLAAAAGHLPKLISAVRIAQYEVLKDSTVTHWGKLPVTPQQK